MCRSNALLLALVGLGLDGLLAFTGSAASNDCVQFRLPYSAAYHLESGSAVDRSRATSPRGDWLRAWPANGSSNYVEFGSRVVLELASPDKLKSSLAGTALTLARTIRSNLFILQAPDAPTAVREAHRLAAQPGVMTSYPVMRRQMSPDGAYAQRSNDPFFLPYFYTGMGQKIDGLWHLENKDKDGNRLGVDLNVMAAWPAGTGQGVTVAVADSGLELNHPELVNRVAGAPHFNFSDQTTNATPFGGDYPDPAMELWTHGTSVAGLLAAEGNNNRGIIGVAPQTQVASWVVFNPDGSLASDEALMDMYQFASNRVSIQNHSWGGGNGQRVQIPVSALEQAGIATAVTQGRDGLGAILVRSGGNDRTLLASANDDGYPNDPEEIAVAAVTKAGRATEYSEPGACLLVGAPSGDGAGRQGLPTLDLVGPYRGINAGVIYADDMNDYRWGIQGFSGTSASSPQVAGVAALLLSVNPKLGYREVQRILALSARHYDLTDPDIVTNGAGLLVSHNVGFGIPDAGLAVWLAQRWTNCPSLTTLTVTDSQPQAIPDAGLRIEIAGPAVPPALSSIICLPSLGPHPDSPTPWVPLVDCGHGTNFENLSLTNKAAIIQRGDNYIFAPQLNAAARAGAAFAIIYDFGTNFAGMLDTDYTPIPSVFVGNKSAEALKAVFQTNASAQARLRLQSAERVFHVGSTLLCEHVGVRIQTDHPLRGDLRVTLLSPQGTRSVLQHFNDDTNPGPIDWTYWSTHHFLESSAGDWTVSVADEVAEATGSVLSVSLIVRGTPIVDTDHDGLDDNWELTHFGSLAYGPKDDPDGDGFCNAREQVTGTDPLRADVPFRLDLTPWQVWEDHRLRLSWPSSSGYTYEVWGGTNCQALRLETTVRGQFPETEWFTPYAGVAQQFWRVRAKPNL